MCALKFNQRALTGIRDYVKVLFVCTGNVDRSRTAEEMFKNIEGLEVRSAGTSYAATVKVTKDMLDWADSIFVMEDRHERALLKLDKEIWRKVVVLDVPDEYYFNQPELRALLWERLRQYFKIA